MSMNPDKIDLDTLFDVEAYWQAGGMPWTIFAYPRELADENGWPPDQQVIEIFALLQQRGLRFGVWERSINDTIYFAVSKEEIQHSKDLIAELEVQGIVAPNFLSQRCEELFSR